MREENEILAIIPARGGSKGLAQKNISELGGKPLLAHTIQSALSARLVTRTVVATDSEKISRVSEAYGAEVPFLRPVVNAGDKANVAEAIKDFQKRLEVRERYFPDIVVILFCTSPFRPPDIIDFLIGKIQNGYKRAYTVKEIPKAGGRYYQFVDDKLKRISTHGAFAKSRGRAVKSYGLFHGYSVHPKPRDAYVYSVDNPICLIDIDTSSDLEMARLVVSKGLAP